MVLDIILCNYEKVIKCSLECESKCYKIDYVKNFTNIKREKFVKRRTSYGIQ